jgi:endonuclease YncB( thermonuclease family)
MAKAVFKTSHGFTVGVAQLGIHGDGRGSVGQQMHDGDTAIVDPAGNLSVRFLGVDAPEVSFTLPEGAAQASDSRPGEAMFVQISDPKWEDFLSDPLGAAHGPIELEKGLREYLEPKVGPGAATNHAELARAATLALRAEVEKDIAELGQDRESFSFFLAFATEVMDGYGRFLCFINRNQQAPPRPPSYNERLLRQGQVTPYFIWPNLDPYRKQTSLSDAVPKPRSVVPEGAPSTAKQPLDDAREWVRTARTQHLGLWNEKEPLRLSPFELRFLARRTPPDRWVIDLSAGDDRLLAPQLYHLIANPEDRLFVPDPYVPLFVTKGWKKVES